jgi:outer membrane lipoprotein-sorting protein
MPTPADEKPSNKPGVITVTFQNVRVNSGLSDKLFVEKSPEKSK